MSTKEELYNICPSDKKEELDVLCSSFPSFTDKEVAIVFYHQSLCPKVEEIKKIIPSDFQVQTVCLEQSAEIKISTRSIVVIDASTPFKYEEVRYLQEVAKYPALRQSVVILLTNMEMVPSITECKSYINSVTRRLNLNPVVCESVDQELWNTVRRIFVNIDDFQRTTDNIARKFVKKLLEQKLEQCKDKAILLTDKKKRFDSNFQLLKIFSNQLPLDVWLDIKDICKQNLEIDVNEFADKMYKVQSEMIQNADLSKVKFYFASYMNYLWGEFLNQETKVIKNAVQDKMSNKIDELVKKYALFFNDNADVKREKTSTITIGSQPVCFDIEHFNNIGANIVDGIIKGVLLAIFLHSSWTGLMLYSFYRKLREKFLRVFKIELSDEKQRRLYLEMIDSLFRKDKPNVTKLMTDYMMPALEIAINDSMKSIIDQLNDNAEKIGDAFLTEIEENKKLGETIQKNINSTLFE